MIHAAAIASLALALAAPLHGAEAEPMAPAQDDHPGLPPLLQEPELVEFIEAPYPPEARAAGVEGVVILALELDESGQVVKVEVLEGPGHGLDEAAAEAARGFRFTPAVDEVGPVPVIIEFAYGFVLDAAAREGARPQQEEEGEEDPTRDGPVNLEGRLVEMGTRRPLPDFTVILSDLDRTATTDADGRFSFRGLPPGEHRLRAAMPGYATMEKDVEVVEGEATSVTLWLRNLSYRGDELVGVYQREKVEVTRHTLAVEEVRRVPGTFGDPVRVVQSLPGAGRSPFSTGMLIIRGSNPEDSAVYVDGIRIPLIYHLDGILSVINSDLVEEVDYLPGGYGVQYGRSMGGVVDVKTRRTFPERGRITWTTDILHSGGFAEGQTPGGRWGFAAGARRSYIDLFIPYFVGDGYTISPRWYDYQLKLERLSRGDDHLSLFIFGFRDRLDFSSPADVAQGPDQDAQGDLGVVYGTHRFIVDWEKPLGDTLALRLTPSLGVDMAEGAVGSSFSGSTDTWLLELRAELPWQVSPRLRLIPGLDIIAGTYGFQIQLPFDPSALASYDPLMEREPWTLEDDGYALAPDVYLKGEWRPLADPDRLLITPGVRLNYSRLENAFQGLAVDPRASMLLRAAPGGLLKASAGIYHQPPQPMEMYRPDGDVDVGYQRAASATVGWEQRLGEGLRVEVEAFHKRLSNLLVVAREMESMDDPYFFNEGIGRITGAEIMLAHQPVGRFFGWLSYTLSRSERLDWPDHGDTWYPFEFDQTHILVGVAGLELPRDLHVSTRLQYVSGNPYTPYAGGVYDLDLGRYLAYSTAAYNSGRLPDYFSTDLRVEKLFTFRRWQLTAYTDLLNLLRGMNPEAVIYNYDYTERAYVRGLPFIPSVGFTAEVHL